MNTEVKQTHQTEVRIGGINLPIKKAIFVSLRYVKGIGFKTAKVICQKTGIDPEKKSYLLSNDEMNKIRDFIRSNYKITEELSAEISSNIQSKKEKGTYQGYMHRRRLRVRGQSNKNKRKK